MRQREDAEFANLLNRLRTKTENMPLKEEDINTLLNVTKDPDDCPKDVLHIYPTNKECDIHNKDMLQRNFTNIIFIEADDYQKNANCRGM